MTTVVIIIVTLVVSLVGAVAFRLKRWRRERDLERASRRFASRPSQSRRAGRRTA